MIRAARAAQAFLAVAATAVAPSVCAFSPELLEHVEWSVGHEGCDIYAGDNLLPVAQIRKCIAESQAHNKKALSLLKNTSDSDLVQIVKDAAALGQSRYRVRENFEWVLQHEGLLGVFRAYARAGDLISIRRQYEDAQRHNVNAVNALHLVSDRELKALVEAPRVAVSVTNPTESALSTIASYTEPSIKWVQEDTTLEGVARETYGTNATPYVAVLASSNPVLGSFASGMTTVSAGTRLSVPSVPAPDRAAQLPVKPLVHLPNVVNAINAMRGAVGEPELIGGRLVLPVESHLEQATIAKYGGSGEKWYVDAIGAAQIIADDVAFSPDPVTAIVAVIDSGVDVGNKDIAPMLWKVPAGLASRYWPEGTYGFDFYRNRPDPTEEFADSHGTHVTGIVTGRQLAKWLPVLDSSGMPRSIAVLSLKIAGKDPTFEFTWAQNAIQAAIRKNADILNLSLSGPESTLLQEYLAAGDKRNRVLLVLAAGNGRAGERGMDLDSQPGIHGSFRGESGAPLENVLFVAALADDGGLAYFSNYGKTMVQIAAPGVDISSTVQGGQYQLKSGTSMAAPSVSMVAAMIHSLRPNLPIPGIKRRILATCDLDKKIADRVNHGCRLHVLKAITRNRDLVELRGDRRIIRADVDPAQFGYMGVRTDQVVRLWMDEPAETEIALSSGEWLNSTQPRKAVSFKPYPAEACPVALMSGYCVLDSAQIRDIVFRLQ